MGEGGGVVLQKPRLWTLDGLLHPKSLFPRGGCVLKCGLSPLLHSVFGSSTLEKSCSSGAIQIFRLHQKREPSAGCTVQGKPQYGAHFMFIKKKKERASESTKFFLVDMQ